MENYTTDNITNNTTDNAAVSYFDGGLLGQIGINILSCLIIVFSLGFFTPLAICVGYGWEVKHTVVDGRRLCFNGTAMGLFGNWVKWWLLTLVTFGIYSFWVNIKVKQWKTKHTHFAN